MYTLKPVRTLTAAVIAVTLLTWGGPAGAQDPCVVQDNGSGTVTLPPDGCPYLSPDDVHRIIDGLPAGTEILLAPIHMDFICKGADGTPAPQPECNTPGGTLGGEIERFSSTLRLQMTGTGNLATFNRTIDLAFVQCEVHTGPRNPGDPVQDFDTEMFMLQGSLPAGDPDFDTLVIKAGSSLGLPSPGHTTLTQRTGGDFQVDSFFDITYTIDFQGAPGGALDGMGGSTTGTVRMQAQGSTCGPTPDGAGCEPVACPSTNDECVPACVNFDPVTGRVKVLDCQCRPFGECHVDVPGAPVGAAAGVTEGVAGPGPCSLPDDGTGTVSLPPEGCEYLSPDEVHLIIDGLPAGTTIELAPIHTQFICEGGGVIPGHCGQPGGSLGGEVELFLSTLVLHVTGTGALSGFNRTLSPSMFCETHTAPRNPGDAVQDFDTDMFRLQGELIGDPDFSVFRVRGGTGFGLPSPGHTTLTRQGPPGSNFSVDSFFDITYEIEFVGAPGSVLEGLGGTTQGTIRMQTGGPPSCTGTCPAGTVCNETRTPNADGTVDICCKCEPEIVTDCRPLADGSACAPFDCPTGEACVPVATRVDPASGRVTVLACDCRPSTECRVGTPSAGGALPGAPATEGVVGAGNPCVVPDNTTGTVTLPPAGCEYLSPDEVHRIIDGLPAGTTIEFAPIHKDFICNREPGTGGTDCPPPGLCEDTGGTLGGQVDCFNSTLALSLHGTGALAGFTRSLNIPVQCQVHTAPRTPGDAVQEFDTEMFRLQGAIFGDPDFDLLQVQAGQGFGLPSPGHTMLTRLPSGDFQVDSFFDITYQIDFKGAPGGQLDGMTGSTTATIRMQTGAPLECVGRCRPPQNCQPVRTIAPDGSLVLRCECQVDSNAIPAVSEWGMLVMILVLLAAGAVVVVRRTRENALT